MILGLQLLPVSGSDCDPSGVAQHTRQQSIIPQTKKKITTAIVPTTGSKKEHRNRIEIIPPCQHFLHKSLFSSQESHMFFCKRIPSGKDLQQYQSYIKHYNKASFVSYSHSIQLIATTYKSSTRFKFSGLQVNKSACYIIQPQLYQTQLQPCSIITQCMLAGLPSRINRVSILFEIDVYVYWGIK